MKFISTIIFLYVTFIRDVVYSQSCPSGWKLLANSYTCYKFFKTGVIWSAAKVACTNQNAALLIIDNAPEAEFVNTLTHGKSVWVGDELTTNLEHPCFVSSPKGFGRTLVSEACDKPFPYVCELDISPNPCRPVPADSPPESLYFPHPSLPYKYIQCTPEGLGYSRLCAKGTIWDQGCLTCLVPNSGISCVPDGAGQGAPATDASTPVP